MMAEQKGAGPETEYPAQSIDELQRSEERGPSVERLEPHRPQAYEEIGRRGERGERIKRVPTPPPRPGAVRPEDTPVS